MKFVHTYHRNKVCREVNSNKLIWLSLFLGAKMGIEKFFTKSYNFLLAISTGVEYLLLG